MAEVLLGEGTDTAELDGALKRFKKSVGSEGVLRLVKQNHFDGAMTKSQKRRQKKLASSRRARRLRGKFQGRPDPLDQRDGLKLMIQDSPVFAGDSDWAISATEWLPDLTSKNFKFNEDGETDRRNSWRKSFESFGQDQNTSEEEIPSIHVCVIAEFKVSGRKLIIVVKGKNDDGTARTHYQFPGGGVELSKGETMEEAAVREFCEETGLAVRKPSKADLVFEKAMGSHTFVCYKSEVVGGVAQAGEEIVQLLFMPFLKLKNFAEAVRGLSPNHTLSFEAYQKSRRTRIAKTKEAVNV